MDVCDVFRDPAKDDVVDNDVVDAFPDIIDPLRAPSPYALSALALGPFFSTRRIRFSPVDFLSEEAPEEAVADGAALLPPREKTRWSLVGGPVRGRAIGVVDRSMGVGRPLGRRSFRVYIDVSISREAFVVRGIERSVVRTRTTGGAADDEGGAAVERIAAGRSLPDDGFARSRGSGGGGLPKIVPAVVAGRNDIVLTSCSSFTASAQ
jgi:hypothetical protein